MRFRTALALYGTIGFIVAVLLTEILHREPVRIVVAIVVLFAQVPVFRDLVRSYRLMQQCRKDLHALGESAEAHLSAIWTYEESDEANGSHAYVEAMKARDALNEKIASLRAKEASK